MARSPRPCGPGAAFLPVTGNPDAVPDEAAETCVLRYRVAGRRVPMAHRAFTWTARPALSAADEDVRGTVFMCRRPQPGDYKAMSPALVGLNPQLPK